MALSIALLLYIAAIVCCLLAAFGVGGRVSLFPLGAALALVAFAFFGH